MAGPMIEYRFTLVLLNGCTRFVHADASDYEHAMAVARTYAGYIGAEIIAVERASEEAPDARIPKQVHAEAA